MWRFQSQRNPLRDQLVLAAPEVNPHEFVRRYLLARPQFSIESQRQSLERTQLEQGRLSRQPHPIPAQ